MKKICTSIQCLFASIVLVFTSAAPAIHAVTGFELEMPPSLAIAQIKMSGDEFIRIHNNSGEDIADLSAYRLESFNNVHPLSSGVSASSQQLPAVPLNHGAGLLLSADPTPTCGAAVAGKLSIGLTDGSGYMHLVYITQDEDGRLVQESIDAVSWTSSKAGDISNVPSATKSPKALYYRIANEEEFSWQLAEPDPSNQCTISALIQQGAVQQRIAVDTGVLSPEGLEPPSSVVGTAIMTGEAPTVVPATNKGLIAPKITELLPNPTGSGTDATDEFIELYNANTVRFDLSGYVLQTGTTSSRRYTIPAGTTVPAKSFMAFRSEATSLSLSNTGAQLALTDPPGAILDTAQAYTSAKDGIAWAYAKGKWQWTAVATPGAANVIKVPATKSPGTKSTSVKPLTKKVTTAAGTYPNQTAAAPSNASGLEVQPIHGAIIALVAAAAVLYGAYEYRSDLALRVHKLRTKFGYGRRNGSET